MIRLYDTAKREKVELHPLEAGKLGIYVCGPTVYDLSHVGHARCYVAFDTIVRHLRASGLRVRYVRNLTDVDDKIIMRARENGEDPLVLSKRFSDEFHHDMELLGNALPDVEPRVSDHMPQIIRLIETLVAKGHGYEVEGDVYFEVSKLPWYGKLSRRNLDDLRSGARVDVDERKRSPLDFALWKSAKPDEPSWPSPWGPGRPGWHIECSAMSSEYLGERFDIHGGGMDLIFPHHENEIAQSTACTGPDSYAHHWLHNGFINVRSANAGQPADAAEEKMSKSLGNFFTIREVCRRHDPEALRLFLLGTHYRNPLSFEIERDGDAVSFPGLEEAERRLAYFYRTLSRLNDTLSVGNAVEDAGEVDPIVAEFPHKLGEALDDDFNTAAALGQVAALFTLTNKLVEQPKALPKLVRRRTLQRAATSIERVQQSLGLLRHDPEAFLLRHRDKLCAARSVDSSAVEAMLVERAEARAAKDFARADGVRQRLSELGVEVMDRPGGSSWAIKED